MKQLLKKLSKILFGDYSIYNIYSINPEALIELKSSSPTFEFGVVTEESADSSEDFDISEQSGYHGDECFAYGIYDGSRIVASCYFWFGERNRTRNFWKLYENEAKLVQIVTVSDMRGKGIAGELLYRAASEMFSKGFKRLYARIWHSNEPSIRAFMRAGWVKIATVIEINPFRIKKPIQIKLPF